MHVIDMRRWEGDPRSMRHDERRCITREGEGGINRHPRLA